MTYCEQIEEHGFAIVEDVLNGESVSRWIEALSPLQAEANRISGGVRNLLKRSPAVAELAKSDLVLRLITPILGPDCFAVRAILFDKTPESNWKVPWHQDITVTVKERIDCDGYGPWSVKAGVLHVQPPAAIAEKMLSIRLHLDPCPAKNGALRVLPGTHRDGRLRQSAIDSLVAAHTEKTCEVGAGGALLIRPLLVHASSQSTLTSGFDHRRVIHLDYAATALDCGLRWFEAI